MIYINSICIGSSGFVSGFCYANNDKFGFAINFVFMILNLICVWRNLDN